jgi:hypothetical protein
MLRWSIAGWPIEIAGLQPLAQTPGSFQALVSDRNQAKAWF